MASAPTARRFGVVALLGPLAFGPLASPANAQSCAEQNPGGGPLAVTITPSSAVFPAPGPSDFNAGMTLTTRTLTVAVEPNNPNRSWQLCLQADSPDMGGYGKPVSDLEWRSADAPVWQPLSATGMEVTTGTGNETVLVELQVLLDWAADVPDSYSADLAFTAAFQ